MLNRRNFINALAAVGLGGAIQLTHAETADSKERELDDRAYWLDVVLKLSNPILNNLSEQRLKAEMPVESLPGLEAERREFSHLEAFGRLLSGIAPWFELDNSTPEELKLKTRLTDLARRSLAAATDPASRDFMNFSSGQQPVVDAAFLALGLIRAPNELWRKLDDRTRGNIVTALKATRVIVPSYNNWLLFTATIEAALCLFGEQWNKVSVDYAIRQHEQWYKGDGIYGDGPEFHWDYYNSFVIYPMLLAVLEIVKKAQPAYEDFYKRVQARSRRYAGIQERMISPEGTFPPIGRSITYRFGAFHLLSNAALRRQLPDDVSPAQVRSALTAVIKRMIDAPGTFDEKGWLTIGFMGHQPKLGENYISTGSQYLCANALLPLGLPPEDDFWKLPAADWTSKKIWSGENLVADHRLNG